MLEDILRDTWFYQKILKEGREQEHGRELQRWGQALVGSVETKFPSLVSLARKCADTLDDPDALQKVMLQVFGTNDVDIARSYLLAAIEEKVV